MILALSTGCHYCTESAPFYRDLATKCAKDHIRVIAVFPQPTSEGRSYLAKEQVKVDEVKEASLEGIRVSGTPTLIIVDRNGKVQQAWIGKLSTDQQTQVFARL